MFQSIRNLNQNVLFQLVVWHFFDIPREIFKAWKNYLRFNLEYFSVPLLLKTYFSYWRGYKWTTGRGFDIGQWFEVKISNLISRILGAFLRTFPILIGAISEVIIFFLGLVVIVLWFFLPIIFIFAFIYGFKFI